MEDIFAGVKCIYAGLECISARGERANRKVEWQGEFRSSSARCSGFEGGRTGRFLEPECMSEMRRVRMPWGAALAGWESRS